MSDEETVFEPVDSEDFDEDAADSTAASKVTKLKKELEQIKQEKAEYLDGWQRAKADYVNVLKRIDDEKSASFTKGVISAAGPLIDMLDTISRAEEQGHVSEDFAPVVSQLHRAVEALGLAQFGDVGEAFDPALHEALGEEEGKENTVTTVLQKGWKYKDTVLRPARVRVGAST